MGEPKGAIDDAKFDRIVAEKRHKELVISFIGRYFAVDR